MLGIGFGAVLMGIASWYLFEIMASMAFGKSLKLGSNFAWASMADIYLFPKAVWAFGSAIFFGPISHNAAANLSAGAVRFY